MNKKKNLGEVLVVIIFFALFVVNLLQVFFRYVVGSSLIWSEEFARCLFLWSVYFVCAYVTRDKEQIIIDVIGEVKGGKKIMAFIDALAKIITIAILFVLLYFSIEYVQSIIERKMATPAMGLPFWIPVSSLIVCSALSIYFISRQFFIEHLRHKKGEDMGVVK